ncbi:MAG: flagellar filament capping protein FliD [Calditerrivibrio sp.]|uniref:flagellar filament capping protein FliD n=1 Tax=Calditerrivibrio sp. TaxID=2792612 RepID=UPI003D12B5D4
MDALRIGGVISGMDTNALVEKLVSQARIPLDNLEAKYNLKTLEKSVYKDISDRLNTMRTDLFNLKLESTFKNKNSTSSNNSVVSATVTPSAKVGSHTVEVIQTAKNSYSLSQFTRAKLQLNSAGVTSITGRPTDFNEGVHDVSISDDGTYYVSTDSFKFNELGQLKKVTGGSNVTNVDSYGNFTSSSTGTLLLNVASNTYTINLTINSGDDINSITNQIETSLNNQLNTQYNTSNIQYFSVRADYNSGNWRLGFYSTSSEQLDLSITGGSLQSGLGLSTTTTSTVSEMKKYHVGNSYSNLLTKINNSTGGLIPGVTFNTAALSSGIMKIPQDATLNVSAATYTMIYGAQVTTGTLNTSVTGLQNAGFSTAPTSATNGTFTINGKKITIADYTQISVNDLIAQINSSGAGVVASYNTATKSFELKSTTLGSSTISLGDFSDTSNILSIMKLTVLSGAQTVTGKTFGTVDTTSTLVQSGLTATVIKGVFTINGVSIYVDPDVDTLDSVISKINNSGAGVNISYERSRDKINIVSTNGIDKIKFGSPSDTSNLLEALNLTDNTTVQKEIGYAGQNAVVNVDGINYVRKNNSISDIIEGVTLNLKSASPTPVTIDITVDTTKAVEYMASFIKHYNELVEKLNPPKINKEDQKYLKALTTADKNKMSETEVKNYEEKWKTLNTYEIIRKSAEFRNLKNSLRSNLFSDLTGITGKYNNLSQIGLNIAGDGDLEILKKGYLVKDTTDLDAIKSQLQNNSTFINAITNYPDDVFNLFAENTTTATGWARRIENTIKSYSSVGGSIYDKIKTYGTIDRQILNLAEAMDRTQRSVDAYYERLWSQFSAMESRIAELQARGNALAGIISSITGGTK